MELKHAKIPEKRYRRVFARTVRYEHSLPLGPVPDVIVGDLCSITIHRTASGYLFRLAGRGTLHESQAAQDFICGAIDDGIEVIIDLCECEYLDSTFLGCLVILHQRSERRRGSFALFADEPVRRKLLKSCSLDRVLSFVEACPEGIGDPVTLQVTQRTRREFCEHLIDTHRKLAELGGPAAETFRSIAERLSEELGGPS